MVFMNRLILLSLLVVSSVAWGSSYSIKGDMNCQIKSSYFVSINNGIPNPVTSSTRGGNIYEVGDLLQLRYTIGPWEHGKYIEVILDDERRGFPVTKIFLDLSTRERYEWYSSPIAVFSYDDIGTLSFSSDFIRVAAGSHTFSMSKYASGNWNGIAHEIFGSEVRAFTFDCQHGENNVDTIHSTILLMTGE